MNNKIDYDDLKYVVKSSGDEYSFNKVKDPLSLLNSIKKGKISLEGAKEQQKDYYNCLNTIRRGNKSANKKRTLANINIHYNARNSAIKFIEDYSSMILEAQKLVKEQEGTGLKILTPNQIPKRLPIALAQIKESNNSESLLNEIRQLFILCIDQKKLLKKVYNNIIKSVKV